MFLLNGKIFFDRTLVWTEDWLGNNNAFVVFDAEVLHDEFAALEGVFAHVEAEDAMSVEVFVKENGVKSHIFANEVFKLVG